MNYRHSYHAGNFADVFKHLVLMTLLRAVRRKEKPFFYLDTHAGRGQYALSAQHDQKTLEFQNGIHKLASIQSDDTPDLAQAYLNILMQLGYPEYYPGSPMLAQFFLRSCDRMACIERQQNECLLLHELFKQDPRVAVHHQDGYQSIKAFLPPKERRGIILIDPPFENAMDWEQIITALKIGVKKFPEGIYAVWYPNKDLRQVQLFLNSIRLENWSDVISIEFNIYPQDAALGLTGCGMLIVNAPWQCEIELNRWLPWVWERLALPGATRPILKK